MKLDLSQPFDLQKAHEYFNRLVAEGAKIELKKFTPKKDRSVDQNKYLHVLLGYIALETGYSIEQAKVLMKRTFGSFMIEVINENKFLVSTADLDTVQMTEFIDFIRLHASEEMDIYLLTPEQHEQHEFEIAKELQYVK